MVDGLLCCKMSAKGTSVSHGASSVVLYCVRICVCSSGSALVPADLRVLLPHQCPFVHCAMHELLVVVVTGVVVTPADPAGGGTRCAGADPGPVPLSLLW